MRRGVTDNLEQLELLDRQLHALDRDIAKLCQADERCRLAAEVPGVGPLTATALVAKVGNARQFPSGRALSAYLGLVPGQNSTGGKKVLLPITKKGDRYLRTLLIHGGRAALQVAGRYHDARSQWALRLRRKSGPNVAARGTGQQECTGVVEAHHHWSAFPDPTYRRRSGCYSSRASLGQRKTCWPARCIAA
jgi:transposase